MRRSSRSASGWLATPPTSTLLVISVGLIGLAGMVPTGFGLPNRSSNSAHANPVSIVHITPPQVVQNGTADVVLDCDFLSDNFLVFKWYHKSATSPAVSETVYTWLPVRNKRKASKKIEPFLDPNYFEPGFGLGGGSGVSKSRYQALRLIRPTTELSGEFTCQVDTLDSSASSTTSLIVYAPAKKIDFYARREVGGLAVSCSAEGLFPEPRISLYRYRRESQPGWRHHYRGSDDESDFDDGDSLTPYTVGETGARKRSAASSMKAEDHLELIPPHRVMTHVNQVGGQYTIMSTALVDEEELPKGVATHFKCVVTLPHVTGYEDDRILALQPGWNTNEAYGLNGAASLFASWMSLSIVGIGLVTGIRTFGLLFAL